MFLLAAMLIQRTGTDRFADLGGLAKGRPALATLVMVVGMLTLAVPGSANFAGEFAILAGVFPQGWGYAAVGAVAIVLAAMYTLRLISGVLHRDRGEAVREESLDLRVGELALVVPLVVILLVLSAWPASISERSFPGAADRVSARRRPNDRSPRRSPPRTSTGSPSRPRSRSSRPQPSACSARSSCRAGARRVFSVTVAGAGFVVAGVLAAVLFDRSPEQQLLIAESMTRDRLAALTQILVAGVRPRCSARLVGRPAAATTSASTTRCSRPPAAAWPSSSRPGT